MKESTPFDRTIFLDLEGPIVTHRSILANGLHNGTYNSHGRGWRFFVDLIALRLVCRAAFECRASLAITSVLRSDPRIVQTVHSLVLDYFQDLPGLDNFEPEVEVTKHLRTREEEIKSFIDAFKVQKYAVIDDRQLSINNFVHVDSSIGFSSENYQATKELLLDEGHPDRSPKIILL